MVNKIGKNFEIRKRDTRHIFSKEKDDNNEHLNSTGSEDDGLSYNNIDIVETLLDEKADELETKEEKLFFDPTVCRNVNSFTSRDKRKLRRTSRYFLKADSFYRNYYDKQVVLLEEIREELSELSIDDLFGIIKERKYLYYTDLTGIKDTICMLAEEEIRERASISQRRKTPYHILGELICKSFNHNNVFPQEDGYGDVRDIVAWIRERYVYLYANLIEEDFKTEYKSAFDMIDLDATLKDKLERSYTSLKKTANIAKHSKTKNKPIEKEMLELLGMIFGMYCSDYNWSTMTGKEKIDAINQEYKKKHQFIKDDWKEEKTTFDDF